MRTRTDRGVIQYPKSNEPMVISQTTMNKFLSDPCPMEVMALYLFYYRTAKWQDTCQPKATTNFVAKGLKCGVNKIRDIKKRLKHLGLIEDVIIRNDFNRVAAHYVRIHFVWSKRKMNNEDFHPNGFPHGGWIHSVEIEQGNTLNRNINTPDIKENTSGRGDDNKNSPNSPVTDSMFEKFWAEYPRKKFKGKAKTSWEKLCRKKPKDRPTWRTVKRAINDQIESDQWQNKTLIPHPATWINQQRWLDDPKEMNHESRRGDDRSRGSNRTRELRDPDDPRYNTGDIKVSNYEEED